MSAVAEAWPITLAHKRLGVPARLLLTFAIALGACVASVAIGLANSVYFDLVNGLVGARETVARGVLFSSWLLLLGGAVVVWRPARFGFRIGDMRRRWRLVLGSLVAGAFATAIVISLAGATPYSDASLFIEVVVVPVTEELVFRAVLLTVLIALFAGLYRPGTAVLLAVAVNGIAFGLAHIGNAFNLDLSFVLPQVIFASILGMAAAGLMARTRSVYPAILLHAVVNGVVVLI